MSYGDLFLEFPDSAQLWVYAADSRLTSDRQAQLIKALQPFFQTWNSHGTPVQAGATVVGDRFLLVAAHVPEDAVSGCGIDASTRVLNEIATSLDIEWESPLKVFYRDPSGVVESATRAAYRTLAQRGDVSEDGMVFDPSITTVGELREGKLERRAADSWLSRYFNAEGVSAA